MSEYKTSTELHSAYNNGLIGAFLPDQGPADIRRLAQNERDKFNEEANVRNFADVMPSQFQGISSGKRAFAWVNYYKAAPTKATKGKQKTGDCVSWAKRTSVECTRTNEAATGFFQYINHGATALVYRSRGSNGAGMSGDTAANTVQKYGVLFEQLYLDGKYDFTDYDKYLSWAMNGRGGLPEDLTAITSKTKLKEWARINSADELADAIFTGHPPDCCSGIGVSYKSDEKGLSVLSGGWSHDMGIVGVDDTKEIWPFRVFIWDQSWGNWNTQITPEIYKKICEQLGIQMPEGYFIHSEEHTMRAVRQGGTISCSSVDGFPVLKLPDLGGIGNV